MNTLPITEADLHAFVDGKLPAARRLEVDAYLAQRPEEAERLRAYTAQNDELRALFNPVLDEAAQRIVRLAAPFAPFPDNISQDTDILSITRTWTFTKQDSLASE